MSKTKEQQAQEYAEKKIQSRRPNSIHPLEFNKRTHTFDYYDILQAYSDGYTACEQSMWRSVEEELPNPDTICLVIGYKDMDFNGRFVRYTAMAWHDGEDFMDAYNGRKYHPTMWMTIPLPDTNTEKK